MSDDQIRYQPEQEHRNSGKRQRHKPQDQHQRCGNEDPDQHFFLLLCHEHSPSTVD